MARLSRKNGRVKTPHAGFARGGLTVRPRKAKPWKRYSGFS
ncbi:hypothetical protein [Salicibibacter cibi]|nr:hypothetical protein [Salicibibacter cibi]